MPASFVNRLITHEVIAVTIIYGRRETRFIEGKEPNFDANYETKLFSLNDERNVRVYL